MAPLHPHPFGREREVTVEAPGDLDQLVVGAHLVQPAAELLADRPSGHVPAGVLAEPPHDVVLALVVELDEPADVLEHGVRDQSQIRAGVAGFLSVEDRHEIGEQPWAAEAPATDLDARRPGVAQHPQGVPRFPDVAVAEDGDRDVFDQLADGVPMSMA